jgi:serine phosphatase RsbU (regulator of sigma subunit)
MRFRLSEKFRISLAWKFLIALSIVILIIIPVASYQFMSQSLRVLNAEATEKAKILKNNLKEKGVSMTRNIALNSASAVAGSDFTFLQNVISSTVASDKEIRFGIIMNQEGRALVHSDPLKVFQLLNAPEDVRSRMVQELGVFEYQLEGEDLLEIAIPIMLGEERWGTLRMGYTLQFLNDEIRKSLERQKAQRRSLLRTSIFIAAFTMLLAAALAIVFSRHIVRAIRAIVRATQQVAQGDFTPRVEIRTGDELETLGSAVNAMAANLDNLNKQVFQKARMESELHTAEMVQKNIIPKKDPRLPNLELASYFRSSSETGGDWFSYAMLPDGQTLSVIIADVTGHGLPAALLTEAAHSAFQTIYTLSPDLNPSEILRLLNQVLIPQMDQQFAMTAFISNFHLQTLQMSYSNAGHNMPILHTLKNGGGIHNDFKVLLARGPRLGDSPSSHFEEKKVQLKPETLLLWYTDGLIDCESEQGESFGKKRVMGLIREHAEESPSLIRDALVDEIMRFTGGMRPKDDVTFIIGKVL